MTTRFTSKATGLEYDGMQHDGTHASAVGISVWAGSLDWNINQMYVGGDANTYVLASPKFPGEKLQAGGWLLISPDGEAARFITHEELTNEYEEVI